MISPPDFRFAKYTAVISDLHLCEAEPINPRFPLWKKYKTRQFFYDDKLVEFLEHLQTLTPDSSEGHPKETIELILNGDIFDFDSVTSIPEQPSFRVNWLERRRGLLPRPERSVYKIQKILSDHDQFIQGLAEFIRNGHRVIIVLGNHDLEMHYAEVQTEIRNHLRLSGQEDQRQKQLQFVDWFYISNRDTLVEHGNQYDAYCVCEDPINPFSQGYNYKTIPLPFGNLACRYLINGMGFFNPHVDSNYIMTIPQYVRFFLKYMIRAQPDLMFTWFFGSIVTLGQAVQSRLLRAIKEPLKIEDRVNDIALRANSEPRMVREMRELFTTSAAQNPILIARELWLDRALLALLLFFVIFELMILVRQVFSLSFFWALIPLALLAPFFLFYTKSVVSKVAVFKEPDERTLAQTAAITGVKRVIYGHTHIPRHEMIGAVEHLNSGTWSPAFLDVECTRSFEQKTFVWLEPDGPVARKASLRSFKDGTGQVVTNPMSLRKRRSGA